MAYTAKEMRMAIVKVAQRYWEQGIKEPDSGEVSQEITAIWDRVPFWSNWLRDPKGGGCPDGYSRPPDPDWCGIFVAASAGQIGEVLEDNMCVAVSIKPELQIYCMSSTARLNNPAKWRQAGLIQPQSVPIEDIDAGDIVVINPSSRAAYGTHITLAAEDANLINRTVTTFEGNATGLQPDGSTRHGVIKGERKLSKVARVWRLDETCFIQPDGVKGWV